MTFSELMEMGGGRSENVCWKWGVRENEEGGAGGETGGLPYYIEVFLEIPYDALQHMKKPCCVYLSFVHKHVLQNNYLNKI